MAAPINKLNRAGTGGNGRSAAEVGLRVALIESDPGNLAALRLAVQELPDVVVVAEASSLDDGYRETMKTRPDVVVMELSDPDETERTLGLAERLADIYPESAVFVTSSVQSAPALKEAMRVGVREYLGRPVDVQEVVGAFRKLIRQRMQAASTRSTTGQIVTVFGPKGGVGTTFVAINLAAMFCEQEMARTVVVDLNLQMGDVATFLNLQPHATIVDVVDAGDRLDAGLLESALAEHPSGVQVLAEPAAAEDGERIEAPQIGQLLVRMKTLFDFIVVDAQHRFDAVTLEALDLSDHVLLIAALELPTIRNVRRSLEVFEKLGYDDDRLKLVINRHPGHRGSERFERSFGCPVFWRVPNDYAAAISSINAGVPVGAVAPESELTASLRGLASRLRGRLPHEEAPVHGARFKLLKRLLPG